MVFQGNVSPPTILLQKIPGLIAGLFFFVLPLMSIGQNQQGFIYGKVITVDEKEYTGMIRWGVEEAFWDDLFVSRKAKAEALEHLSPQHIQILRKKEEPQTLQWDFMSLWTNPPPNHKHAFRCRFGDLRSIEVTGESTARLQFKDGSLLDVEGGSDVGGKVYVYDTDGEQSRLEWERIYQIVFSQTSSSPLPAKVAALYGTVLTTQGAFSGYIQWDDEECLSTDQLEGKNEQGKHSFQFGEVEEIRIEGEMARVSLFSGKEYLLGDTDDLSDRNHGIIVKHMEVGRIFIPWEEFRFVKFEKNVEGSGPAYHDFLPPSLLRGTIETREGQTYKGRLVFDLDEQLDIETIEGQQDGIRYFLPLRNISTIERRNHQYCAITLMDGDKLFLGQEHDVSDNNWGVLVWTSDKQRPKYFTWDQLKQIDFEK